MLDVAWLQKSLAVIEQEKPEEHCNIEKWMETTTGGRQFDSWPERLAALSPSQTVTLVDMVKGANGNSP